ncbi:methyltransferase [Euzebya rosea]|uniref:methyltransferase n=1 Tax=Euzebya rosea TaxID=2052804 RepID=UPI000D3E640F|nr:methyltransferase [Euzebya rosea]
MAEPAHDRTLEGTGSDDNPAVATHREGSAMMTLRRLDEAAGLVAAAGVALDRGLLRLLAAAPMDVVALAAAAGLDIKPCEVLVRQLQLAGAVTRLPDGRVAATVDEQGLRYTLHRWHTLPRVVDGGPPAPTAHLYPMLTPVLADRMLPSHRVVARSVGGPGCHLLDIGGGMSPVGQLLVSQHPDARVTVVDHPEVLQVLAERLDDRHTTRFTLLAGDLLVDPLPEDVDVVLLSGVLHLFGDDDVLRILRRAVRATVDGGTVAVVEPLLREDGQVDEAITAYEIGLHLRHPQGGIWPYSRLAGWFARAGLTQLRRLGLPSAASLVTGTVGRPATDRT